MDVGVGVGLEAGEGGLDFRPAVGEFFAHRQQRVKNWAMFAILVGLVALFFVLSIVRMGGAGS